jgi:hypothetical protein
MVVGREGYENGNEGIRRGTCTSSICTYCGLLYPLIPEHKESNPRKQEARDILVTPFTKKDISLRLTIKIQNKP